MIGCVADPVASRHPTFAGPAGAADCRSWPSKAWESEGHGPHGLGGAFVAAGSFVAVLSHIGGSSRRARRTRLAATKQYKRVRLSDDLPKGVNFYEVLGVDKLASQDEIRAAYKRVIRETHPDVNPSEDAAQVFIQAQEAFRWLSDPQQREVYDGVGGKFGEDAIYDYSDEPILGSLTEIRQIQELTSAIDMVNQCRKEITTRQEVKIKHHIMDIRQRFRVYGSDRVKFVRNFINRQLKAVLQYPRLIRQLHPFERLSVELALTQHWNKTGVAFGKALACLKDLRRQIHELGTYRATGSMQAERGRLATFIADEGIEEMFDLVTDWEPVFQQFIGCQRAIFKSPSIDLDKPTVVFVGAPNVGKSSLVRSISTGRPEVNSYPYTTKKLTIGHLWHFIAGTPLLIHGQIVDSPGLRTSGGDHNLMDKLTMGSMEHLPTAVVFVFDPYPYTHGLLDVEKQVQLREALRAKFPRRPWLDVITKIDVEEAETEENIKSLLLRYPDALQVSAFEGTGLDTLNMEVRGLLEEMTRVVRQLQRTKIRQLRMGDPEANVVSKEALALR